MITWIDALVALTEQVLDERQLQGWRVHVGAPPSGSRTPLVALVGWTLRVVRRSDAARYGTLLLAIEVTGLSQHLAEEAVWQVVSDLAERPVQSDQGTAVDGRIDQLSVSRDADARGEAWWKTEAQIAYAVHWPR